MSVQKAVLFYEVGPPSVLQVVHDFPVPTRKPGEVFVQISSTSVNPIDTKVREGRGYAPKQFPKVPGGDVAGVVREADSDSQFKVGDKVFALTNTPFPSELYGTYLEYFPVKEEWLAAVPDNLPLDQAGGVPLAALTAWQALGAPEQPKPGQRVLVLAAAGGVGHFAVQFAKALGAHVVGTAGPTNQAFLKELGVDEVFNYKKHSIEDTAVNGKFDIVLDLVGGEEAQKAYKLLKPNGLFAHIFNTGTDRTFLEEITALHAEGKGPRVTKTIVQPNGAQLAEIAELIRQGKVRLVVQKILPLEKAAEGHEHVEKRTGIHGKVVLKVQDV